MKKLLWVSVFRRAGATSLTRLFIRFAILLPVISIAVTLSLTYMINQSILSGKITSNKELLMNISTETTNAALSGIAKAVNSIESEPLLYQLINPTAKGYELDQKINGLSNRISRLIMQNKDIDTVIVTYSDYQIISSNSIYEYDSLKANWDSSVFQQTVKSQTDSGKRFYLVEMKGREKKIGVVSPVFKGETVKDNVVITVILNQNFGKKLNFINETLYLSQGDTKVSVWGENPQVQAEKKVSQLSRDLIFESWKLTCEYDVSMPTLYREYFLLISIFAVLYLFVVFWIVRKKSSKMFSEVDSLTGQLSAIKKETIAQGVPDGKGFIALQKQRMSYARSVLISYFLLAIAPVLIISVSSYNYAQHIIENNVGSMIDQNIEIVSKQMDIIFKDFLDTGKAMALSGSIQDFLDPQQQETETPRLSEIFEIQQRKNTDILNIAVYDRNMSFRYSSMYTPNYMSDQGTAQRLAQVRAAGNRISWQYQSLNHFNNSLYRVCFPVISIYSDNAAYGRILGYLVIDFNNSKIDQAIAAAMDRYSASMFIADADKTVLMGKYRDENQAAKIEAQVPAAGKWAGSIVLCNPLYSVGWTLYTAVPEREYSSEKNIFVSVTALIGLAMVAMCILFSFLFFRLLSYNINKIRQVAYQVEKGNLAARFSSKRKDEIYALGESVNQMLVRINTLIREKYVIELKAKDFELNLLQSQINPHFLCNTLRTIEYMATVSDPRTVSTIKKLIYIFRRCLNVRSNLVPIKEEMDYIGNYTEIQQIRFGDKFVVELDLPEELSEIRILQFTIQPLVENAIYHGVELLEQGGLIRISVQKKGGLICIQVKDNGPGMSAERIKEIRDRLSGKIAAKSIGLINVNERIQLQYGEACGVSIESVPGEGTTVSLLMREE